jgi:hypothetical protein
LPKDFVLTAWEQWCKRGKGRMRRGQDCLVLATRGYQPAFAPLWADIKLWSGDTKTALARINGTGRHRKIFASVKGPIKKLKRGVQDKELIAFIRHLEVLATDFDLADSNDRRQSIGRCRNLLADGTLAIGRAVWRALVNTARDARLGHGTVEIESVIENLSQEFVLKDRPVYAESWRVLEAGTAAYKKNIESALPNKFVIDRASETGSIAEAISQNALLVLYAESGSGKSALVKTVLDKKVLRLAPSLAWPGSTAFSS